MNKEKQVFLSSPVFWITLLSLIWAVIFALDLAPVLRGGPDWEWNFKPILDRYRLTPLLLGLTLYAPLGLWLRTRRSAGGLLVWSLLGGIGLTLAAVHLRGDILYRLYTITVSGRAAGWHMAAAHIENAAATLSDWPQFMAASLAYSPHINHSPPGIVLLYFAASHLLDKVPALAESLAQPVRWLLCQYIAGYTSGQYASAWLGMLMPLWGGLTVLPLYALGRRVYGEEAGRWGALWWPLVPGYLMFSPLPNTFYALPSLVAIGMLWKGLTENRMVWIAAAGLLMSVLTFLTFTFTPLVLFAGLLALGAYWLKTRGQSGSIPRWHWPFKVGLFFGIGLGIVWLVSYVTTGLSFWNLWQSAQQTQIDIAQIRAYGPWIVLDLNDLFMFTGWPLVLLAIIAIWYAVRNPKSRDTASEGAVMTVAAILTLVIIDLYGTPRGEWGRIMVFMSPWLLLAAASQLGRAPRAGWPITAAQGVVACVMVMCLQVLAPEFRGRAAPVPPVVNLPASSQEVDAGAATFGGSVRLEAVSGKIETQVDANGTQQSALFLWLTWDTLQPMNAPYAYLVQAVSPNGTPSGDATAVAPFTDAYPMTCWKPADGPLIDRIRVPIGQGNTDEVSVSLAVADPGTGEPLRVVDAAGRVSDRITLGPFH
jgi:hypothetical protein